MVLETAKEGGRSSQRAQSWCSTALFKSKLIKAIPDKSLGFFSSNFHYCCPGPVLLDTINRNSQDRSAHETGGVQRQLLLITSTDLAVTERAPFHSKVVWGDGKAPELSVVAEQGSCSAAPSDFRGGTLVLQLGEAQSHL